MEFTSADVNVRVCREDSSATYRFRCPECTGIEVKAADSRVVELLVASGVELETWSLPAELGEPRDGDPIDHDDLLDFHRLLQGDDWLDGITDPTRS